MSTVKHDESKPSLATWLAGMLVSQKSMVVLDCIAITLGGLAMIYAVLRFLNILGPQPFIEDCNFTLDVFDGIADVFVFYGVALESRTHLLHAVLKQAPEPETTDSGLNILSEHTGLVMVVLGLMLEVASQFGLLAGDIDQHGWFVFPLCLFGFVIVGITIQQISKHLVTTLREWKKKA